MRPPAVVLAYHGVGHVRDDEDPERLVLDPERFEAQLRALVRLGYRFVTAAELPAGRRPPTGTAVASFDDGWRDAVTIVLPILQRLGLRASFYPCSAWTGGRHPLVAGTAGALLDADELRALVAAGMEVGSHARTHRDLRTLDDDQLAHELSSSREEIAGLTGSPCRTIAYPYGLVDARVRAATQAAGYDLGLGWLGRSWTDRFEVPRLPAPPRHGAARLLAKLSGARRPGR